MYIIYKSSFSIKIYIVHTLDTLKKKKAKSLKKDYDNHLVVMLLRVYVMVLYFNKKIISQNFIYVLTTCFFLNTS